MRSIDAEVDPVPTADGLDRLSGLRAHDEAALPLRPLPVREEVVRPRDKDARVSLPEQHHLREVGPLGDEDLQRHPFLEAGGRVEVIPAPDVVDVDVEVAWRSRGACRR